MGQESRPEDCGGIMKVTINLSGWADSLDGKGKVEFVLQLLMYKYHHDCDWSFDITRLSENTDVRYPYTLRVVATRCCSMGLGEPFRLTKNFNKVEFTFTAQAYSLRSIYEGAEPVIKQTAEDYKEHLDKERKEKW